MKILVTGAAGFIGFHVTQKLLERGDQVLGLDNLNGYYDPGLKKARLSILKQNPAFSFSKIELKNSIAIESLFRDERPERVIHLAAQPGVRYSLKHPHVYVQSNLVGFLNILEGCRNHGVEHLVYASSSSIYGLNSAMPYSVHDNVDHPVSLYAATKKANELMAHSYSHLFRLPTTGLRFFTVYGPWGRPDMAPFLFTKAILAGESIQVFNHGKMLRDFTYVDDIAEGVVRTCDNVATANDLWSSANPDPGSSSAPYRVYNIGNNQPIELLHFIETLENCLGIRAKKVMLPAQPGDVLATFADVDDLTAAVGFKPSTSIEDGVQCFVDWYRSYYPEAAHQWPLKSTA